MKHLDTIDVLRTYGSEYKLIIVGDATMSPYEITQAGGSVEHWNEESGEVWLKRLLDAYRSCAWINPQPSGIWPQIRSIERTRELMEGRMYPLTLAGLDQAIGALSH